MSRTEDKPLSAVSQPHTGQMLAGPAQKPHLERRRGLLAGLGALSIAPAAQAALPTNPDAALLALHAQSHAAKATLRRALEVHSEAEAAMFEDRSNVALAGAAAAANDLLDDASEAEKRVKLAMAQLPAMTMAGLMVKALVLAQDVDEGATAGGWAIAASVRADAARFGLTSAESAPWLRAEGGAA